MLATHRAGRSNLIATNAGVLPSENNLKANCLAAENFI